MASINGFSFPGLSLGADGISFFDPRKNPSGLVSGAPPLPNAGPSPPGEGWQSPTSLIAGGAPPAQDSSSAYANPYDGKIVNGHIYSNGRWLTQEQWVQYGGNPAKGPVPPGSPAHIPTGPALTPSTPPATWTGTQPSTPTAGWKTQPGTQPGQWSMPGTSQPANSGTAARSAFLTAAGRPPSAANTAGGAPIQSPTQLNPSTADSALAKAVAAQQSQSLIPPLGSSPYGGPSGVTPEIQSMLQTLRGQNAPTVTPASLPAAAGATAQQAAAQQAAPVSLNLSEAEQTRQQQQQSINDLLAASEGRVPSAAEIQLTQSTDRNVANQLALASALQGRSVGGALKQASDQAGAINADAAGQAAALRANEQAAARSALSSALSGVRGQDIGTAENQAALTQGTNITNAQLGTGVSQTNAQLGTNTSQFNAGQQNNMALQGGIFQQQAALANASNQLTAMGLTDQQRTAFLNALVSSKGQDLTNSAEVQRNLITQQYNLGNLNIDQQKLALQQMLAKYGIGKDIVGAVGQGAAAVGSSQWWNNLLNGGGTSGTGSSASGFVDSGPGNTGDPTVDSQPAVDNSGSADF
jgi:hypothetical protein